MKIILAHRVECVKRTRYALTQPHILLFTTRSSHLFTNFTQKLNQRTTEQPNDFVQSMQAAEMFVVVFVSFFSFFCLFVLAYTHTSIVRASER